MQGLMSSYPLTLATSSSERSGSSPTRAIATVDRRRDRAHHLRRVGRAHAPARRACSTRSRSPPTAASARSPGTPRATSSSTSPRRAAGRVLHTLNIRLFPDDIVYIADHAEDEVVFVDRSLLKLFWPLVDRFETVKHVVVMDDGADDEIPDDPRMHDYEALLADGRRRPSSTVLDDENQRRRHVLHERHHRQPEGRRLLAPLDRPALDGLARRRRRRRSRETRHDHAGRADVPRQRVGPRARPRDGRRRSSRCPARTCSRRRSRS